MYFTLRVHLILAATVSLEIFHLYLHLTEFSWKIKLDSGPNMMNSFLLTALGHLNLNQ